MARIEGVDLPRDKRVEIALTYIYGIGLTTSQKILVETGVSPDIRVRDLSEADVQKIREKIGMMTVEGDLRREVHKCADSAWGKENCPRSWSPSWCNQEVDFVACCWASSK